MIQRIFKNKYIKPDAKTKKKTRANFPTCIRAKTVHQTLCRAPHRTLDRRRRDDNDDVYSL